MNRLEGVHPKLVQMVRTLLERMSALGHPMVVVQGLRTAEDQHQLWRQGREIPGPGVSAERPLGTHVTNADGYVSKSNHQAKADGWGHAVDCTFLIDGKASFDEDVWEKYGHLYGEEAERLGLMWGGRWKDLVDRPHVELKS